MMPYSKIKLGCTCENVWQQPLPKTTGYGSGSTSPQLARLPWEYLYDVARDNFFALSIQTPIVRYLEMSTAELAMGMGRTIHILVMIADPLDMQPRLDVNKEWYQLQAAFQDLENDHRIKLHCLSNATKLQLQRYLRKNEIDIFHFIGHGRFDEQREEGLLAFESERGQAEYVSADVLARLFRDNMPHLVYLNSCETAQTGVHDPLTGTAQELVQQGIPAVVRILSITHRWLSCGCSIGRGAQGCFQPGWTS